MTMGTTNAAYGTAGGVCSGGPGATNSIIPLTKFHDAGGPNLPPRKDLYMTPRNALAPPNAYDCYDSYTYMNPAGSVFLPQVPPPQYAPGHESPYKVDYDDQLYAEIPGEYLTVPHDGRDDQEYANISPLELKLQLQPGNLEDDDTSAKPQDTSIQEVYGNL